MEKFGKAGETTDDDTRLLMLYARWIIKATNTHSELVILTAFPRQRLLRKRASILYYTYTACFVSYTIFGIINFSYSANASSKRNVRTRHAVVTKTYLIRIWDIIYVC